MFDRFQTCLGYYWYAAFGYTDYWTACEIHGRLGAIGYKPGLSNEYSEAMDNPKNALAKSVFERLCKEGY